MKNKILAILEERKGESVSGESLALSLMVSRTAVWKAIKKLKSEGHKISSATRGGYKLENSSDVLHVIGIERFYDAPHKTIVFDETDSTNKQAKIMALDGAEHGTVVVADFQTAGKGRRDRSFFSPKGSGVYFSIILKPKADYVTCQKIVPLAAVAVTRAIKSVANIDTEIKWVNDVYYLGKKIVGISTESIGDVSGNFPDSIILGIGINVSTDSFPEELIGKAGSLGVCVDRCKLVAVVVNEIMKLLPDLSRGGFIREYRKKCFVLGKNVTVFYGDRQYEAKAVDINESGALIVEKHGERITLVAEEVSVRPQ